MPASPTVDILPQVLLALAAVIVLGRLLAWLLAKVGQPPVIGEMTAGILLGPSFIGASASAWILPASAAPFLGVISQLGVVLYMFVVGLELQSGMLRRQARATIAISQASIALPFVLGVGLAWVLYVRVSPASVPFTSFALFMGAAMSVTAFPVLARILTDRRLTQTPIGGLSLCCAAINDVTAWCMLAVVVGVARADVNHGLTVVIGAAIYVAVMLIVVRPLLIRFTASQRAGQITQGALTVMFVLLLASALATEAVGIHAIFGAFLLGALVPHDSPLAETLTHQLRDVVTVLLLPAFFAFTGMRTRIDLVSGTDLWLMCLSIIAVATVGKFGGTFVAARLTGYTWRDATVLGTLMNTRGLMELIVLNVGLEMGVISPLLFAMMVIMALVTTVATAPIVDKLLGDASGRSQPS